MAKSRKTAQPSPKDDKPKRVRWLVIDNGKRRWEWRDKGFGQP